MTTSTTTNNNNNSFCGDNNSSCDYVSIIEENQNDIIRDLMTDVAERLRKTDVLSQGDYDYIVGCEELTKSDNFNNYFECCAERLLKIIIMKSPFEVAEFVHSLKEPYPWLYELFPEKDETIEEALIIGGVPKKPKRHVMRKKLIKDFKNALMSLERGKYLVLYGMPGTGRSTLAADCLYDSTVLSHFDKSVMWVSIGESIECQNDASFYSYYQSRVNSFLGNPILLTGNVTQDQHLLKKEFKEKECLLILDDVRCQKMVEALDFGLKTVIITNDKSIMKDRESVTKEFEMPQFFDDDEALELFAKGLKVDYRDLPREANAIHNITRGFPLSISLLAGFLEDHKEKFLTKNTNSWQVLREKLGRKENGVKRHGVSNEANDKINQVINIAVESIPNYLMEHFRDFALFVEDINIKPQVMQVIWDKHLMDVENDLFSLTKKSLLMRKWVKNSYVYGIHDCILSYLKQTFNEEEKKALHRKLVQQYRKKCKDDFSKLPHDDNYIFFYLGYHLKNADELDEFSIYLKLEFIEAKLLVAGPVDLLSDYSEYREFIIQNQESSYNNVMEIQTLLEKVGQIMFLGYDNRCPANRPDLIQFILQECLTKSSLYKSARRLAEERSRSSRNTSYLQFPLGPVIKENSPVEMLPLKKHVSILKFTIQPHLILIAYDSGEIELYNILTKNSVYYYATEGNCVKGLSVSCNSDFFLSYSSGPSVSIWPVFSGGSMDVKESVNGTPNQKNPRTPSPSQVQHNHSPMWPGSKRVAKVESLMHQESVTSAQYAVNDPHVCATTTRNKIFLWKNGQQIWFSNTLLSELCYVTFIQKDATVVASDRYCLYLYNAANGEGLSKIALKMDKLEFLFTDVEDTKNIYFKTRSNIWVQTFDKESNSLEARSSPCNEARNNKVCQGADISKYIGLAYSNGVIEIIDKQDMKTVLDSYHRPKCEVSCLSMNGERIVAAYSDLQLCVWPLPTMKQIESFKPQIPYPPTALCWHVKPHAATASSPPKDLLVWEENKLVHRVNDVGEFELVALSPDGKMVAYWQDKKVTRQLLVPGAVAKSSLNFDSAQIATFLRVYGHGDDYLVLAGPSVGQLLVWHADNMRFLGRPHGTLKDAFLVKDFVVCVDNNGAVEVHSLLEPQKDKLLENIDVVKFARVGGARLAIGYESQKLRILDIPSLDLLKEEELPAPCEDATFSPDGSILVVSLTSGQIMVIKVQTGNCQLIDLPCCVGTSLAVTDDGILCLRGESSLCLVDLTKDSRHACTSLRSPPSHLSPFRSPPLAIRPLVIATPTSQFVTVDLFSSIHVVQFLLTQREVNTPSKLAGFFTSS